MIFGKIGEALERMDQPVDALRQYSKTVDVHRRLMETIRRTCRAGLPMRVLERIWPIWRHKLGQKAGALLDYREVLRIIEGQSQAEPANTALRSRLSEVLTLVGSSLAEQGQVAEAACFYDRGLAIARALTNRPTANQDDFFLYAEELLDCPLPSRANPKEAVRSAERAVDQAASPSNLELPSRAYSAMGDRANAAVMQRKAIALLAAGSADRKAAEARLLRILRDR